MVIEEDLKLLVSSYRIQNVDEVARVRVRKVISALVGSLSSPEKDCMHACLPYAGHEATSTFTLLGMLSASSSSSNLYCLFFVRSPMSQRKVGFGRAHTFIVSHSVQLVFHQLLLNIRLCICKRLWYSKEP